MTTAKQIIDGFTVTIEPNDDRDGVNCYVEKGRASASLAVVEDFGALSPGEPEEVEINNETQGRIKAFARRHGY